MLRAPRNHFNEHGKKIETLFGDEVLIAHFFDDSTLLKSREPVYENIGGDPLFRAQKLFEATLIREDDISHNQKTPRVTEEF
jgi:hypothetical protein